MAKPKVIVIGPMKSGTTWLHSYLLERGDVCLPTSVKETFYFDRYYAKGLDWYRSYYDGYDASVHNSVAEVAPSYFHCDSAPQRIRSELGDVRLLAIVRDPIRRSWSHYCHLLRYGYTRLPLRQACDRFPAILEASCYRERLRVWEECFPPGSLRVCSFETLESDEFAFCKHACDAMDMPFVAPIKEAHRERNSGAASASTAFAAVARLTAGALRKHRLHFVVNGAKRAGFRRLVYGSPETSRAPKPSDEDIAWLKARLLPDIVELGQVIDRLDHRWLDEYL